MEYSRWEIWSFFFLKAKRENIGFFCKLQLKDERLPSNYFVTDDDCNGICVDGLCNYECSSTLPCPTGRTCVAGKCRMQCHNTQCPVEGQSCVNNICIKACEVCCVNAQCSLHLLKLEIVFFLVQFIGYANI